jgi:hypothetical protein
MNGKFVFRSGQQEAVVIELKSHLMCKRLRAPNV